MPARKPRAFTLVELLMVIGIITILIVLGISLARRVTGTGKKALTEQTIRVLDTALGRPAQNVQVGAVNQIAIDPFDATHLADELIEIEADYETVSEEQVLSSDEVTGIHFRPELR